MTGVSNSDTVALGSVPEPAELQLHKAPVWAHVPMSGLVVA